MEHRDAAMQVIEIGDCLVYGSARGEISFGIITKFDDLITPPQVTNNEEPGYPYPRARYESKAAHQYAGKHVYPTVYVRLPTGDVRQEWAPYWAYRVQVSRLTAPGDHFGTSPGLSWLTFPKRLAKIPMPDWAEEFGA